jgi:hypothetical protein
VPDDLHPSKCSLIVHVPPLVSINEAFPSALFWGTIAD